MVDHFSAIQIAPYVASVIAKNKLQAKLELVGIFGWGNPRKYLAYFCTDIFYI